MGWAPGDIAKKEQAKIDLALAREGMYRLHKLRTTCANIQHKDKREALLSELDRIEDALKNIEVHLNR